MHETIIHKPFEGMHLASPKIDSNGSVHITPQTNSPRLIIVQEGHGSIVLTDLNIGGVREPKEVIEVPGGVHVQITNLLETTPFSLTIIQKTSLDEGLFKEA